MSSLTSLFGEGLEPGNDVSVFYDPSMPHLVRPSTPSSLSWHAHFLTSPFLSTACAAWSMWTSRSLHCEDSCAYFWNAQFMFQYERPFNPLKPYHCSRLLTIKSQIWSNVCHACYITSYKLFGKRGYFFQPPQKVMQRFLGGFRGLYFGPTNTIHAKKYQITSFGAP